jgi:hypothetical protein
MPRTRKRHSNRKIIDEIFRVYDEMAEMRGELGMDLARDKKRNIALLNEIPRRSLLSILEYARYKQDKLAQLLRSDALDH